MFFTFDVDNFLLYKEKISVNIQDGYNILEIDDETHLFGRYFNNRDNSNVGNKGGNIGTFELTKIN